MTADPFFDEFRRLRPDVPVVLLPPAAAADVGDAPQVPEAVARAVAGQARTAVAGALEEWWQLAGAARPAPGEVRHSWDGEGAGTVRSRVVTRSTGSVEDPNTAVDRVAAQLSARGWQAVVRRAGRGGARLAADRDDVRLEVTAWGPEGPWDVGVVSAPALVGALAGELRRSPTAVVRWGERPGGVTR